MNTMTIRNFDESLQIKLRARAARHGVSMEDEALAIVRDVLEEDADVNPVDAAAVRPKGEWNLDVSFEDLLALGVKPDKPFD